MRFFLGKFSKKYPEQVEKKMYAGGDESSSQYGEVKIGDYVFVSHAGKILGLWKAREYAQLKNTVHPDRDGVLLFDEIKGYKDVSLTNHFTKYKHFIHNLDLVNRAIKSTKGLGFIPITTTEDCPPNPADIDFKTGGINIYIALEKADIDYKDGDIRVTIDSLDHMKITSIDQFRNGKFKIYEELNALYEERNAEEGKYSIRALNDFALKDQATKKRPFLIRLIEELESKGYMKVSNPIRLYDYLLVGRKKWTSIKPEIEPDEDEVYQKFASLLNFNPNLILYGPPGTGKTYATTKIIDQFEKKYFSSESSYENAKTEKRVKTITFHQSYSYEEFIEGIRPNLNDDEAGAIGYKLENGLFKELCINAEKELIKRQKSSVGQNRQDKREVKPYYMIIDEINRGNISKIFGELITLIEQDKRGSLKSLLPYSKKEFSVPSNLFVIGTMNTADRSIAVIDTALRRRFTFAEIEPDSVVLTQSDNSIINDTIDTSKLLDAMNINIMNKYDRDHRIGHSYFMGIETLNDFYQTWYYKILPLLGEYFYNDVETLGSIVGKSFYDQYGNINDLSLDAKNGNLSQFEKMIIEIYETRDNG